MGVGLDPDADGNLDLWELFRHYDRLYFRGALVDAAFSVECANPRMKSITTFGTCSFGDLSKITLYEPMLQYRTNADLKNALLHLMIHAIIFVKHGMTGLGHGPVFRDWMDAINTCPIEDHVKPISGYCITTTHDFSPEKSCNFLGFLWKCESCGNTLLRAKKLGPPSDSCCIENVSQHATCGNMLCHWHNHKRDCGGTYVVTKPPVTPGQKMAPKGRQGLLTETTEMSKSQRAAQQSDSDSDEVQENSIVTKPNSEGKHLSQVCDSNTKSPGNSSLKKAGKSNMPEDFQKAIVLSAAPRRRSKPKQEFVAWDNIELWSTGSRNNAKSVGSSSSKKAEDVPLSNLKRKQTSVTSEKHGCFSLGSCDNAKLLGSNTSRKSGKLHEPDEVKPSASQKKMKLVQDLSASEKYGPFSLGSCNKAKPPGSSASRKAGKWHKSEGVEKSTVPWPAVPPKKLKHEQDLVAKRSRSITTDKVGKLHKPDVVEKSAVPPSVPPKKTKLEQDRVALEKHVVAKPSSSVSTNKVGKLHKPEGIQKACGLPAAPLTKLKPDLVASEKNVYSSVVGCGNTKVLENVSQNLAHKKHEHEWTQKHISVPTAPRSMLKQQNKTGSSLKARKQPEDFPKITVQPAVPRSKLKQTNRAAPERRTTRGKAKGFAKKKEYVCFSLWQNFYESECSSGSAEPLVNKRTVRRKRERERSVQITYSRSRKRSISEISSIKAQPDEEVSSPQTKPPSQHLEIIVIDEEVMTESPRGQYKPPVPSKDIAAVCPTEQVMTEAPRGQSKPPAPCKDVPLVPPAHQVMTEVPRGQSKLPAPCMDVLVVPPADQVMTEAPRGQSKPPAPSKNVAAIRPAGQAMTEAPRGQSKPPAPCMELAVVAAADLVMTEAPRGQCKPPAPCMDVRAVSPADQVMTEAHRGQSKPPAPSKDVAVVPPADQMMTEAPRGQSKPPAPSMDVLVPPTNQVVTQAHRGLSQPPAPSMDIVIPPADHRDQSDPSTRVGIAAIPPADQVKTQAPLDQSQTPAPCSIAIDHVIPPHSADPPGLTPSDPSSWPDVIEISDDDD